MPYVLFMISNQELRPRPYHEFYMPGDFPERQKLRFQHHEARRLDKIRQVVDERNRLIHRELESMTRRTGSQTWSDVSQMLENVVTREAKRLERHVRNRMKRKAFVERKSKQHAQKLKILEEKMVTRVQKISQASKQREQKARELQQVNDARFQVRDEMLSFGLQASEMRRQEILAKQAAEEEKLDAFFREKERQTQMHSAKWETKQMEISEKVMQQAAALAKKSQELLQKREAKQTVVDVLRARHMKLQQLKGEEATLRLIDALEKKRQIEKSDSDKRSKISQLLSQELDKVATMQITRDMIVNQRRQLSMKQQDLDVHLHDDVITPGPGEYDTAISTLDEVPAPKISLVRPKLTLPGTVDFEAAKAATLPAPGQYTAGVLNDGTKPWNELPAVPWKGGAEKSTYVDDTQRLARLIPGPGTYSSPPAKASEAGAPRIHRNYVTQSDHRSRDWLRASDTPGPATYTVDEFTRREKLEKQLEPFDTRALMNFRLIEEEPEKPQTGDTTETLEI